MMSLLISLIFIHFIADWALQSEWVAINKGKYWFVMFAHCIIWTGCIYFGLIFFDIKVNLYNPVPMWKLLFLFIGHYLVDLWKCRVYKKVPFCQQKTYKHLYIDQLIHIIQVIFVGVL